MMTRAQYVQYALAPQFNGYDEQHEAFKRLLKSVTQMKVTRRALVRVEHSLLQLDFKHRRDHRPNIGLKQDTCEVLWYGG